MWKFQSEPHLSTTCATTFIKITTQIPAYYLIEIYKKKLCCLGHLILSQHNCTMSTDLIGYLYAATVAAGGIMGYVKAGKHTDFI